MRKSSTTAAAKRAGAKPSRTGTHKEEPDNTTPETRPESTQTAKPADKVVADPEPEDEPAEANTDGSTSNGDNQSSDEWMTNLKQASQFIDSLPPEMAAIFRGANPPVPTEPAPPAKLSKNAQARFRHHVRSAAGRLAAALEQVDEARQGWLQECAEASAGGYPHAMIQGQALDAGLELDEVPDNPNK